MKSNISGPTKNLHRPVPSLDGTLDALQESLRPFLSPEVEKELEHDIASLRATLLPAQEKLNTQNQAWVDQHLRNFYLNNRLSLSFYSNVFYALEQAQHSGSTDATERAARLIYSALLFRSSDFSNEDQYPYLFSTARLPGVTQDEIISSSHEGHIILAYRGHFFRAEIYRPNGELQSLDWFRACIRKVIQSPNLKQNDASVGYLTALPRSEWAHLYLSLDEQSKQNLDWINRAVLFVALDFDCIPQTRDDLFFILAHGNAHNRWYDKSHQLIITGNGMAGINRDHTAVDGQPTARYLSEIFRTEHSLQSETKDFPDSSVSPMTWNLSEPVLCGIQKAKTMIRDEISSRSLVTFDYMETSENYFKDRNISADASIQLAIQLAAFMQFGRLMSVNEAVLMRHFDHGRYDTIFCVTQESKDFVHACVESQFARNSNTSDAFQKALTQHKALIKECKQGNSPVFHLTALAHYVPFLGTTPHINEGLNRIINSELTTSNPGAQNGLELSGFTDTAPNVIGISYLIKNDRLSFHIKADHQFRDDAQGIKQNLIKALNYISVLIH